jgi:hypothetical protein
MGIFMTTKNRSKNCFTCGNVFFEKKSDSNSQWGKRKYCSPLCNSKSPSKVTSIFERLKRFQVIKDGCWGWIGNTDGKGYGTLSNRKGNGFSPEKAHRVSYEKFYGEIPKGMNVCHACDNPVCTNPQHLWIGTQKENMQDCGAKGRVSKISIKNLTFNHKRALTEKQVNEIKNIKFVAQNGRGQGRTKIDVAKEYGVCVDLIKMVIKGTYYGKRK